MTLARVALLRNSGNLNNPNVPLTASSLATWLGGGKTKAGTLVTDDRVMGLPAYYRAMAIRSGVEAALPIKVYHRADHTPVLQPTVLDSPWPGQTRFGFRQTMKMNEIAWGNAFARKYRDGADVVVRTIPIHPRRVRVEPVDYSPLNPEGKMFLVIDRKGQEHRLTSWEVMHIPFMSPDGLEGVSAFSAFRESLGIAIAGEDMAGSLYANGMRQSGIIKSKKKLNDVSAARLKAQARAKFSGTDHAGEVMILDDDAEWQNLSIPPQDAQLLQSRMWSIAEIARMVGVLPHMIGDNEKSTSFGTGIEHQFLGWMRTSLHPSAVNTEQIYTEQLLPGGRNGPWEAEHSFDGLLRGDSAARATFYAQAIQWGWLTRNEVRLLENLTEADGLDEFLTPSNMTLISIDGTPHPINTPDPAPAGGQ